MSPQTRQVCEHLSRNPDVPAKGSCQSACIEGGGGSLTRKPCQRLPAWGSIASGDKIRFASACLSRRGGKNAFCNISRNRLGIYLGAFPLDMFHLTYFKGGGGDFICQQRDEHPREGWLPGWFQPLPVGIPSWNSNPWPCQGPSSSLTGSPTHPQTPHLRQPPPPGLCHCGTFVKNPDTTNSYSSFKT